MALSWNEIKDRAVRFSKEWEGTTSEEADAKSFLDAFFDVFGISRKRVGFFEHKVKKLNESDGYIDLLWKGMILVEMKSLGKDLDKAFSQAIEYVQGLKESEVPKYILVCDFVTFRLYDSEEQTTVEFKLKEFVKNVQHFSFIAGYQKRTYKEQDPVNIKAADLMGNLHDQLKDVGYIGHPLEVFLVRLLFCLFAEDTTIFNKLQFQDYIEQRSGEDGSDLASRLQELFQVLNTPKDKRLRNLDEQIADFPYVNGKLFEETLPIASFDKKMRQALLDCCYLDWSKISPAIFGSMFQSVMNPDERRNLGAHYTSEKNILKLIKPLFLDDLVAEFEICKGSKSKLIELHKKITELKFLDPACGCGNFLVITYRELRLLEIKILKQLHKSGQGILDVSAILSIDVDMMYGIEYEEFPARIAEVAMWLIDHQMNMLASDEFGQYFVRLPLRKSANIFHGDALLIDWNKVISQEKLSFIMGNPPFIGSKRLSEEQKSSAEFAFGSLKSQGSIDFVGAWYVKATKYIKSSKNKEIRCAFVSTNSITQGEQVVLLWKWLLHEGIIINFAHRTFKWKNEAKGVAAVHCVIIGFGLKKQKNPIIYEYDDVNGEPHAISATNINPYLIDSTDIIAEGRSKPISNVKKIVNGSIPADGGNLILSSQERKELIQNEPDAKRYIRKYLGAEDFLNNIERYCLWLIDCDPDQLRKMPLILKRVELVRTMRLESEKAATRAKAATPMLFTENRQPTQGNYLAIPRTSSENRRVLPIGFLPHTIIAANDLQIIPKASLYDFGILSSKMHMVWTRTTAGRLKSDIRYSVKYTYNTFVWPDNPNEKRIKAIEEISQQIIDIRGEFHNSSLADLYGPLSMPQKLVKAHRDLDKAVDLAYRSNAFLNDIKRLEFLFELYASQTSGLFKEERKIRNQK
ncbi:DNA methyltransferase [Leptospira stimsonii]|uniref:site-specific DNA-methyltransferase (adenine-specific) n=1 Tax=Leptospira stimsonii TaxID=2202203 RepID=A0A396YNF7_9LEPT|nr:DNA methyltransferase [Leptospira stimsonii]RHX83653.1 SAM-dependent methyltransferase [Leptospira stimsonii]